MTQGQQTGTPVNCGYDEESVRRGRRSEHGGSGGVSGSVMFRSEVRHSRDDFAAAPDTFLFLARLTMSDGLVVREHALF